MPRERKGSKETARDNKISEIVLTLLFIITSILIVVILCVSFFGLNISTTNRNITKLESNWSMLEGVSSRKTNLPDLVKLSKSGSVNISRTLPDDVIDGDVLLLLTEHQNLEVYVDGFIIYSYESTGVLSKFGGKQYCFVPLSSEMSGKKISIKYLVEGSVKETYIAAPIIGSTEALISYLFRMNFFVLTFGGFFVIAGGIIVIIGIIKSFSKNPRMSRQTVLAGAFLFVLALKQLLSTGMLQMLGDRESFMYLLYYCCKLMIPVTILWYFIIGLKYKYRILEYMCQLGLLNAVVTIVIFITGIVDIYRFETSIQFITIVSGVTLLYALMVERVKIGQFKYTIPILTAFFMIISGMLEMIKGITGGIVGGLEESIAVFVTAALMLTVVILDINKNKVKTD